MVCNRYRARASDRHNWRTKFPIAHNFRNRVLKMQKTTNPHLHPLPRPEGEDDAKRLVRVLPYFVLTIVVIFLCQLFGCETANYVPPVTAKMASANSKRKDVDPSTSLRTSLAE